MLAGPVEVFDGHGNDLVLTPTGYGGRSPTVEPHHAGPLRGAKAAAVMVTEVPAGSGGWRK